MQVILKNISVCKINGVLLTNKFIEMEKWKFSLPTASDIVFCCHKFETNELENILFYTC